MTGHRRRTAPALYPRAWIVTVILFVAVTGAGKVLPVTADTSRTGSTTLTGTVPTAVASGAARLLGPHDPSDQLLLNLGLPLRNQTQLTAFIANEASPRVAMTNAEFDARYAPSAQQVQAVKNWALAQRLQISWTSPDGLAITVKAPTSTVAAALQVQINDYQDAGGRRFYASDHDPEVPASLGLQSITGLANYYQSRALSRPLAVPSGGYFPSELRATYDLADHAVCAGGQCDGTGQTIGLVLWGGPVSNSDLQQFAANTGDTRMSAGAGPDQIEWIGVPTSTFTTSSDAQQEVALDVEYAHGMATHSHLKYYLANCTIPNGGKSCSATDTTLEDAIAAAANDSSLHVVSDSFYNGNRPATDPYVIATTNSFLHAVAVGTTFYFATGDQGLNSGCFGSSNCGTPTYPADSPYVVAVGGTHLETGANDSTFTQYSDEEAWSYDPTQNSGGGGGCAPQFPRPSWQVGVFTATCLGRAEPDLAAVGDSASGAYVYVNGKASEVGGTSLATPLIAGMAAVTDRHLSLHSDPLMGWAAPTIYTLANSGSYRSYFHDVTCGSNGFPAGAGWDQATGWGSEDWFQYTLGFAGAAPTSSLLPPVWGCQNGATNLTALTGVTLNGVACPAVNICYAVGTGGTILKTIDSGTDWTSQSSGVTDALDGIACPDVNTCYVTTFNTEILKTIDGGSAWTQQSSTLTSVGMGSSYLNGIACPNTTTCYAVGFSAATSTGGGVIVATTDGSTWTEQAADITDSRGMQSFLYGVACPAVQICYVAGSGGVVGATNDGGAQWSAFGGLPDSTYNPTYRSVACPSTTECYVAGYGSDPSTFQTVSIVVHTTNGGGSWTAPLALDPGIDLYQMVCITAGTCAVSAGGTYVLLTSDSGAHWGVFPSPAEYENLEALYGLACPDNSSCYAVGQSGLILGGVSPAPTSETLSPGWNLVDVPRQLSGITSTAALANSMNGLPLTATVTAHAAPTVTALATYADGQFSVYVPGYSTSQTLQPGQGVYALSPAGGAWTMTGMDFIHGASISLQAGWNLVAAPYPPTGLRSDVIAHEIDPTCSPTTTCSVSEIAGYTHGGYQIYRPGVSGSTAFTIAATSGMWVQMSANAAWTPQS